MLLSVIIPTFNRYPLLRQAIQSVFEQQDVGDFEILVVDDGSGDDTPQITRDFPEKVRYFRQEHAGLNAARNLALSESRGEFVALLDDDDLWLPFKSSFQLGLLNAFPETAFIYSDFFIFFENGRKINHGLDTWFGERKKWKSVFHTEYHCGDYPSVAEFKDLKFFIGNIYEPLLSNPLVLPSTSIIRKEKIRNDLKFPEHDFHCGDWDFFAQLSRNHDCVFIPFETTLNRSHADPVRLTGKPKSVQRQCQVNLIGRVWGSDKEYYSKNTKKVEFIRNTQLLILAQYQLLEGEKVAAGKSLNRIHKKFPYKQYKYIILWILCRTPFSGSLLRLLLKLRERLDI